MKTIIHVKMTNIPIYLSSCAIHLRKCRTEKEKCIYLNRLIPLKTNQITTHISIIDGRTGAIEKFFFIRFE